MNQIVLSKDKNGNVTVLTKVPDGIVDASGNSLDPAYRVSVIKSTEIAKQAIDAQAKADKAAADLKQAQDAQAAINTVSVKP